MLLDMLALGVIVPVLPKLIIAFEGGDVARAAQVVGIFGAAWALAQFVCAPVLGALSDRFGRRPVLLLSLAGLGLDYILMALAPSVTLLFIGRIISGMTSATFATANAYVADVTPPEKRAAAFGLMGAAWGVGFVLGPALGGVLGDISLHLPFWVAAALTLANVAYGFFVLPESLPPEKRAPFRWSKANPVGSLGFLRSHKELAALATIYLLFILAHQALPSVFVLYADYRYGWDAKTVGLSLALIGAAGVVVQAVLVRQAVAKLGERGTLLLGLSFATLSYVGYGLASQGWMAWAIVPVMALGGFSGPGLQGLVTRRVGAEEQGRLQGALGSVSGVAGLVGPLLFTFVFAASAKTLPGLTFLVAGVLTLAALLLAMRFGRVPSSQP